MDEFTRSTVIQGNIDAICNRKKPISIDQVACKVNDTYPRIIIVEGAPGVGKTTLAWELCRRWAKGIALRDYSLVLLLRLRDKRVVEAKQLQDFFFHSDKIVSQGACDQIVSTLGHGVLIILEGFDELPEDSRKHDSLLLQLICGELLPQVTVLVTSRPWASLQLRSHFHQDISQRVEILGFTKDRIDEFLESVTQEDTKLLCQLRRYVKQNPPIHAAMYIPLNAVIIVETCKEEWRNDSDAIIPTTITGLYTAFSKALLLRYLYFNNYSDCHIRLNLFEDLPPAVYERFCGLCRIAYEGIHNRGQLVFKDIPDDLVELGFLQSVTELYVTSGVSVSYNFIHLTVQEFLAAFYVSLMLQQEPNYKLPTFYESQSMYEVSRFLAGITKLKHYDSALKEILPTPTEDDTEYYVYCDVDNCKTTFTTNVVIEDLFVFNLLFESQNLSILKKTLGCKVALLHIGDNPNPMDYFSAGWCIGHSECQWKLAFQGVVPPDCAEMLVLGVQQCKQLSRTLNICDLYIGEKVDMYGLDTLKSIFDLRHNVRFDLHRVFFSVCMCEQDLSNRSKSNALSILGSVVEECKNLKEVELYGRESFLWQADHFPIRPSRLIDILEPCCRLLCTVLRLRSLRVLSLHKEICMCFTESMLTLFHTSSLEALRFCCYSAIHNFDHLTFAISSCKRLKHLNFCINFGFEHYSVHVAELLVQTRPRLISLCLQQCNLTDVTAECTLLPLTSCVTALKTLNLAKNKLGEETCMVIADILNKTHLSVLNISECDLPHSGIVNIIQVLTENTKLRKLNFSGNNCSGCAEHFEEMLCINTTLTQLKLIACSFQEDETTKILNLFTENKNTALRTLAISRNGFVMKSLIDKVISENTTLHHLSISLEDKDLQHFGPVLVSALTLNRTLKQLTIQIEYLHLKDLLWLESCKDYEKVRNRLNVEPLIRMVNLSTESDVSSSTSPIATDDDQPQNLQQGK